jgi:hypothetical protein
VIEGTRALPFDWQMEVVDAIVVWSVAWSIWEVSQWTSSRRPILGTNVTVSFSHDGFNE